MDEKNDVNGVLVVDKPENMTSANVVGIIKRLANVRKVGHTGTLDPFATGVLICCINRATRLASFFLKDDKTYDAVLFLGTSTDTQDRTGTILSESENTAFPAETIYRAFERFKGTIRQQPPVYSALKHDGVPLYKLARKGRPVQKPAREVHVSRLDILDIRLPEVRFQVDCSAGTYVRTLCADIGEHLGCGGHLKDLRRIESGGFSIKESHSLEELRQLASQGRLDRAVIGMNEALRQIPACVAENNVVEKIKHGRQLYLSDVSPADGSPAAAGKDKQMLKIIDARQRLVAIVKNEDNRDHLTYCCVFVQ